jgi:tRNA(Ile)-lysidine synthase
VASVDHGTGSAATEATARVLATAARHGLSAISDRLAPHRPGEAAWREGRWSFLRAVAEVEDAPVVTAHTRDDHIETVVMRLLRGAGARGLAGLFAPSPVERPFLSIGRSDIVAYATVHRVEFTDDPTNASRDYFRNRIRIDVLPAIRSVAPDFERDVLDISRQAADLRVEIDSVADAFLQPDAGPSLITLDASGLDDLADESLRVLLPSLLSRAGVTMDRRGLARLVDIVRSSAGTRGQLSGGFEAVRGRADVAIIVAIDPEVRRVKLRVKGETRFGSFRFLADPSVNLQGTPSPAVDRDPWRIHIPRKSEAVVRQWSPGDRLTMNLKGERRRVKRFFADAGIVGPIRAGWPVVVCGEDVIWIPGIRASQAAIPREGRMVEFRCERVRG